MSTPKFSIQNQSILYIAPVNGNDFRPITGDRIYIGDFVCGEWYDTGNQIMAPRIVKALNERDSLLAALQSIAEGHITDTGEHQLGRVALDKDAMQSIARAAISKAEAA
jgi:hypothetical protein